MTGLSSVLGGRMQARDWLQRRVAAAVLLVVSGDWLLFDERPGLALPIFVTLLALASGLINPVRAGRAHRILAVATVSVGLWPLVVEPSALGAGLAVLALVAQAWLLASAEPSGARFVKAVVTMPFAGPFRLGWDAVRLHRLSRRSRGGKHRMTVMGWLIPAGLSVVFLTLFVDANPVLESWTSDLDLSAVLAFATPARLALWGGLLLFAWPFLHVRLPGARTVSMQIPTLRETALFGPVVVLRSLVLFNAVFALQSGLDATYLWGGHSLPAGMTHASYAHRGAYPLMVSALLAGAFAIAAARYERAAEGNPRATRILLILFMAQNVLLVASAMRRLDLYIDAYGMTQWRLSALIWMGLVWFGLAAIAVRIVARKTTAWLVRTNAAAALVVLYACTIAPFADIIARSNLSRCIEGRCTTVPLDWCYLSGLGPQIVPALDDALRRSVDPVFSARASALRTGLAELHENRSGGWRQWSLRSWRLGTYLATHGAVPPQTGSGQ